MASKGIISGYLLQEERYYSESKEAFILIDDMHPTHAANAAARYMQDAATWAVEAGEEDAARPMVWMVRRPLFLALVRRANLS